MPGARSIMGMKRHAFSHVNADRLGGFAEGTVEHDVNSVAGRIFKGRSKNAQGQSIITTYKEFHVIGSDGKKTGEVFAKAMHRSRSFTLGEIIGLILSYILLTPFIGALIHTRMFMDHKESVLPQTVNYIKVDIDTDGNIKTPDNRPSTLQQVIPNVDLKANSKNVVNVHLSKNPCDKK